MANRSMNTKYKRSLAQRVALGAAEAMKPAYRSNKPLLREIAACIDPSMIERDVDTIPDVDTIWIMYNPSIHREELPAMWASAIACDGELVKRGDYLRR